MSNELTNNQPQQSYQVDNQTMERLILGGDLSQLTSEQKVIYYNAFCQKLGLNPLTKPFQIINFQGKQILYATKDATEQLRKIHGVSITKIDKLFQDDLYIVTVTAEDAKGRQDVATGAINIGALKGDAKCNAIMKSETKAKRRVTLSICGLGILDDSEVDTIGAYKKIDVTTGEVIENKEQQPVKTFNIEARKAEMLNLLKEQTDLGSLKNLWQSFKKEAKGFNEPDFIKALDNAKDERKNTLVNNISNEDINQ